MDLGIQSRAILLCLPMFLEDVFAMVYIPQCLIKLFYFTLYFSYQLNTSASKDKNECKLQNTTSTTFLECPVQCAVQCPPLANL